MARKAITKDISKEADEYRVDYMLKTFPRPWRIEAAKVKGRDTWVILDASDRRVFASGRGALALIVASVNGFAK